MHGILTELRLLRRAQLVQLLGVAQEAVQVDELVQRHLPRRPRAVQPLPLLEQGFAFLFDFLRKYVVTCKSEGGVSRSARKARLIYYNLNVAVLCYLPRYVHLFDSIPAIARPTLNSSLWCFMKVQLWQ